MQLESSWIYVAVCFFIVCISSFDVDLYSPWEVFSSRILYNICCYTFYNRFVLFLHDMMYYFTAATCWSFILLKILSLIIISVHLLVGDLYNPLGVISLGLYSTGSLHQMYSKASQHWIALFSHGLPYTLSPWKASADIPWRELLALDKFYCQSLLVGQVASGSHSSLWIWHIQ